MATQKFTEEQFGEWAKKAADLGWTDIRPRLNRNGKLLGYMGKPKNYIGPLFVNIYKERLYPDYLQNNYE